jgi:4,4'-diaponeurosporenoate glycosyltransferase
MAVDHGERTEVLTVIVVGWIVGWLLLWRLPTLDRPAPHGHRAAVSIVVPARNEADRLPRLLASVTAQTGPDDQVLVVDDHSSDGTANLARAVRGVDVVVAPALPEGWTGKSWACSVGAGHARHDVLCFLDADVTLEDGALDALLTTWHRRRGLVSVQPCHATDRVVEWLSMPFNVVGLMGLGIGSVWPPRRQWGAAGPCLVTSKAVYERVGGHARVRSAIAEDLALAAQFDAAGERVTTVYGGERVRFRMYRGLRDLVEGWSKNIASGARHTPPRRALSIALWVTAAAGAALAVIGAPSAPQLTAAATALTYLAWAAQFAILGRRVGRFGPAAVAWPILIAFFVLVFVTSLVGTVLLHRVRWSGRTVPITQTGSRT